MSDKRVIFHMAHSDGLDSDQSHLPRSVLKCLGIKRYIPFFREAAIVALRSDCADAQTDWELQCPHMAYKLSYFISQGCSVITCVT